MSIDDYKIEKGQGCIFDGKAGSGKTTLLCKMVAESINPVLLAFSNKAIGNVKSRLLKNGYDKS